VSAKPILEEELHALADNRLPPDRKAEIEAWLAQHPPQAERVGAWRAQNALLHRAFDPILAAPLPTRLLDAVRNPARGARFSVWRLAAVVAWLALGAVAGFVLRGEVGAAGAEATLPRQAAIAHAVFVPEVRHPVEVTAAQEAHLVAWLSKRLGAPLKAPNLEAAGYALLGGRLLAGASSAEAGAAASGGNGAVAQFMYQDARGARLTLYVRNAGAEAAKPGRRGSGFRYAREGSIGVFYWIDEKFGYALAGDPEKIELLNIATLVYSQISP